jgi:hypothetical protein
MKRLLVSSRRYRLMRSVQRVSGLVGYYPLNEISGIVAVNYAPKNKGSLNGVIAGSPVIGQPGVRGRNYNFDAVDDTIAVAAFPVNSHNVKSFVSIANWAVANTNVTGFGAGSTNRTGLSFQNTNLLRMEVPSDAVNGTARVTSPTGSILLNTWNFVGFTTRECDPAVARAIEDVDIFINGVKQTKSLATAAAAVGAQTQMNLGSYAASNGRLNGKMQHAAYFNRVLADSEMRLLAHKAGFV